MEGSVTFSGQGFDALRVTLNEKLKDHVPELGELVVRRAKELSPYDTGHNRRSITMDAFVDGERVGAQVESGFTVDSATLGVKARGPSFRIYTQSGYGAFLELGTRRMPAQPYIYPAFEQMQAYLAGELEGVV